MLTFIIRLYVEALQTLLFIGQRDQSGRGPRQCNDHSGTRSRCK